VHDLACRGTRRTVNVTITEIAPVQQLRHALQVPTPQRARDLIGRRHDLLQLRVGEGDRRHFFNPPGWKSGASCPVLEGEEVDQTRQALLEIYCAVVLATPYNDFATH
jgi:hypothetical protein